MKIILRKLLLILVLFFSISTFSQDAYIGEIRLFAGNFAPRGWAFCQGQLLPIGPNDALFSILGTTYGGDGRITFALPDLRGRVPVGPGRGPGLSQVNYGQKFGSEENTLTVQNLPSHNHEINASNTSGTLSDPEGNVLAHTNTFDTEYTDATPNVKMNSSMVGNTGGNLPVNNVQPSLGIHYIICLVGIYPPRS